MKIAVSNSCPLIHLATVGIIDCLFRLYDKILIPESVYDEVVIKGKKEGHSDALIIEQAISNDKVQVKNVKIGKKDYSSLKLHQGEVHTINLALNSEIEIILLDDEEARIFARKLNLKVKGTLGILYDLVKKRYLSLEKALHYLRELNSIMYLSSDVYNYVADEIKKIYRTE
ncbi:MAG: hypothetical protein EU532_07300 [Promethearchaeota archaeon]|nr:MAG: hypothetical protein EU532_07300 [Candidatus Lokiarchaeota archaeon]